MPTRIVNGKKQRYDYFLIWGHGLPYQEQILRMIQGDTTLKIIDVRRFRPRNLPRFVNEIYSCDYAPREHLKAKTEYLMTLPVNDVVVSRGASASSRCPSPAGAWSVSEQA